MQIESSKLTMRNGCKWMVCSTATWLNRATHVWQSHFASVEADLSCDSNDATSTIDPAARKYMRWQLLLLFAAALLLLPNLSHPLIDRSETRCAEIAREILVTGYWSTLSLNFEPYYDKPPLFYWLCAVSFQLFGVAESSCRIVPSLSTIGLIAVTMWFTNRNFGRRIGLISGVVLGLSSGVVFMGRYLLLDSLFSLLICAGLFTAHEAMKPGDSPIAKVRKTWWLLSALFCGLAILTKGPVALVLWVPPVAVLGWLAKHYARPSASDYFMFGTVVAAVLFPWVWCVLRTDPNYLIEFLGVHNLRRFAGAFHAKPFWYFFPVLLVAGHPWSFLTIPLIRFVCSRSPDVVHRRPVQLGFLLLWSVWCFAFFSFSKCKLPTYLLPSAPAFSIIIAHYLEHVVSQKADLPLGRMARHLSPRLALITTCFLGLGCSIFALTLGDGNALIYWAILWGTITLLVAAAALRGTKNERLEWLSVSFVMLFFSAMMLHHVIPAYSEHETIFGTDSLVDRVTAAEPSLPIATVAHQFPEVPFYLRRSDIPNFKDLHDKGLANYLIGKPTAVVVVESSIDRQNVIDSLPDGCTVEELGRRGPGRLFKVALSDPSQRF